MTGPTSWLRANAADLALAVGLGAMALVELEFVQHRLEWGFALSALLSTTPLLLRRRQPSVVAGVVGGAIAVEWLSTNPPQVLAEILGLLVATYSVVVHSVTRVGLALGVACTTAAAVVLAARQPSYGLAGQIISVGWLLIPIGVAVVVRRHRRRAEQALEDVDAEVARVLAEERSRVARELHDVIAHTLAVVILHARGGRQAVRHGETADAEASFDVIASLGEHALADMRRLLTLLREPSDRSEGDGTDAPDLRYLDDLVAAVRSGGVAVELLVQGSLDDLPAGVNAAAYRCLQESLTNVIKHAPGATARVRVERSLERLELEVIDTLRGDDHLGGDADAGAPAPGTGHGLVGIRERVAVYGGDVESGPTTGGGFRVCARLPLIPA